MLSVMLKLVTKMNIHKESIERNLDIYAPFACTERVMMAVARQGGDRQEMHERLREHALAAWQMIQTGQPNPLVKRLQADEAILRWISAEEIGKLADVSSYTGIAESASHEIAGRIRKLVGVGGTRK
jgi:adenylosuccinate lyase